MELDVTPELIVTVAAAIRKASPDNIVGALRLAEAALDAIGDYEA
jgi:hypothetical protein